MVAESKQQIRETSRNLCGSGLMQILTTGTNGQVGWELTRQGPEYGFDTVALNRNSLDICDFQAVKNIINNSDAAMVKQLAKRSSWATPI